MAVTRTTEANVKLLTRLMRAEAEGDGESGMLMVGNVGVNRARAGCIDFKEINNIREMVFQSPSGFEATQKGYFHQSVREMDIKLARMLQYVLIIISKL